MSDTVKYEVKAVKFFMGMDGQGFNANLYRNGKKIAFVVDSGDGGCLHYHWTNDHYEGEIDYLEEMNALSNGFAGESAHEWFVVCLTEKWDLNRRSKKSVVFRKRPNFSALDMNPTYERLHNTSLDSMTARGIMYALTSLYPDAIFWSAQHEDWTTANGKIAEYAKCAHAGEQVHEYDSTSILGDAYYCGECRELLQVG